MSFALPDSLSGRGTSLAPPPTSRATTLQVAGCQGRKVMDTADWDALFAAVAIRLRHTVGEDLHNPPNVPAYSAALSASLIQAVVLDCVGALDQLHTALKQERSQRPTP